MVNGIQSVSNAAFNKAEAIEAKQAEYKTPEAKADSFEAKGKENNDKIGFFRLAFKWLKQDQIDTINETGKLPKGSKLVASGNDGVGGIGKYVIANNILNVTPGTRTLPETHELKRNFLGFTVVVPKDTESILIRK